VTAQHERLGMSFAEASLRLRQAIGLVWGCAPGLTTLAVVLAILQGVTPLVGLYLLKLIIDALTAGVAAGNPEATIPHLLFLIALAALTGTLAALARLGSTVVGEAQAQVVTDSVADTLHSKSIEVDLEYYENPRYHDVLHRAQQEAPYRPTRIVSGLLTLGQSGMSLLAILALLCTLHWGVALLLAVATLPAAVVRLVYSRRLFAWERQVTKEERRAYYFHRVLTDGAYAKEIRAFALGHVIRDWYRDVRAVLRRQKLAITRQRALTELAMETFAVVAVFGALAFIAVLTITGRSSLGSLVMYFQALQTGLGATRGFLSGLARLFEDSLFLSYYNEFMALQPRVTEPPQPRPVPRPIERGVVLDGVSFAYPGSSRKALESVSLAFRPGEVTAIVGPNGSGKSTLVKLICRIYDPSEGVLAIDGVDLREVSLVELRRRVATLFQDYGQYHLSARQNIWLGNTGLQPESEAIVGAARASGADEVVSSLAQGYDTVLGRVFDGSEELSVGEWQKVALARALVRDADILILDEPTSALDPAAEAHVLAHLRSLASGRIVIVVSHHLALVRCVARVVMLGHGRVLETGTPADLLTLGGVFAQLCALHAR
jgi:ATP-binding cassette subfamily B protein